MVVLGSRTPSDHAGSVAEWNRETIREAMPRTIDELLAREPSFSLYRRQSSWFGNPTASGVSLRDTGASAASRTLVLLDGVPQNDPFGGWVSWPRYDAGTLESARILPPASSLLWGNQSPAGVIELHSRDPFDQGGSFRINGGSHGQHGASITGRESDAQQRHAVSVSAFGFESDGFHAVHRSQRGTIDRPLDLAMHGADVKTASILENGIRIDPTLSWYHEDRGNGTPLARNSTDAVDLSLRLSSDSGPRPWQITAWHQEREFQSTFTSVNADRTTETVALDQYDVPGRGTGVAFTLREEMLGAWSVNTGMDARRLVGATHENVGTFRNREAGGSQNIGGWFVGAERPLDDTTRIDVGWRVDFWNFEDARRVETSLSDGSLLRDDRPSDRSGLEPSASLQLRRRLVDDAEARISAGSSFRLPTLNELYRPYRVRNDSVEANPELDPERFFSIEGGIDWHPSDVLTLGVAGFHHRIHDAIANVPIAGGSASQRRNVDLAEVSGIEFKTDWEIKDGISFSGSALWSDTSFVRSRAQPLLEGLPFPQAPELRLAAECSVQIGDRAVWFASGTYGSSQFEDALATRLMPDFAVFGTGLRWRAQQAIWQLRIDNLLNEEVVTGISSDRIRTLAAPRSLWLGVEWWW